MTDPIIRVLHITSTLNVGGIEQFLMSFHRRIDRAKLQFDYLIANEDEQTNEKEVVALGGRVHRWPRIQKRNAFTIARSLRKLLLAHPEYNIVHFHNVTPSHFLQIFMTKTGGARTRIIHSHSIMPFSTNKKFLRPLLVMSSSFCFACSERAGIFRFGNRIAKSKKWAVLPNAIDVSRFAFNNAVRISMREMLDISDATKVYIHVGRLEAVKNHRFLLEIFSEILKLDQDSLLLIVGEGSLDGQIRQYARDLNISNKVFFLGLQTDVSSYLQSADVFLLPSLSEGLSIALIEAQGAGLPCLATDNIGLEVKINDNVEFISIDEASRFWAERAITYASFGTENRALHSENVKQSPYNIDHMANKLEQFYCSLPNVKHISFID